MTDPQTQQQLLAQETRRAMDLPAVRVLAGLHGLPVHRCAGLYALAQQIGGGDARSSLRLVESCAQVANGNPTTAVRHLHGYLPTSQRGQYGDGTVVRIQVPTWVPSRSLVAGPGGGEYRERVHRWEVHPDLAVRWRHQNDYPWRPEESAVGTVVATKIDPVTGDLSVWCKLHRDDVIEACLFRTVSASPGIDMVGSRAERGYSSSTGERTQTWMLALVREISLCGLDEEALGGVTVTLVRGAPADAAAAWAMTTRSADHDDTPHPRGHPHPDYPQGYVHPVTRTPAGLTLQHRGYPTPGGLRVM